MTNNGKTMAFAAVSIVTGILSNGGQNKVLGAISVASFAGCLFHEGIENAIKNVIKKN